MTSEALNPQHVWLLPGWQNSDPGHWQSLWQDRYGYQRLEQQLAASAAR
jgi:predicted alpha/beta hydrolase family esterase